MSSINTFPTNLLISDFEYSLHDEQIARYPLEQRDRSKLLVWNQGKITDRHYSELPDILPTSAVLVFNNSKVIEARLIFQKPSGGQIEIFCLEPQFSPTGMAKAMQETGKNTWYCLIGGASKWKAGQVLEKRSGDLILQARFLEKRKDDFLIEFSWIPKLYSFEAILHQFGSIPLPPYLKRLADVKDSERYQTVYAKEAGSVAAPTAGLHFTESLLKKLADRKIESLYTTLHVGAGTFMPVKSVHVSEHHMHEEYIEVTAEMIEKLISKLAESIIAVGTTSLRTLESLYWLGMKIFKNPNIVASDLFLEQKFPYENENAEDTKKMLLVLLGWAKKQPGEKIFTKTQLFIVPGYSFKIVRGLITNFHQPQSTLLLLVAALVGPGWKEAYAHALTNNYRFLSYGDGCFFLP